MVLDANRAAFEASAVAAAAQEDPSGVLAAQVASRGISKKNSNGTFSRAPPAPFYVARWLAAPADDAGLLAARLQDLYMDQNRKARRIKRSLCALQHILSRARARCSRCWTQC